MSGVAGVSASQRGIGAYFFDGVGSGAPMWDVAKKVGVAVGIVIVGIGVWYLWSHRGKGRGLDVGAGEVDGFIAGRSVDKWSLSQVLERTPTSNGYRCLDGKKVSEKEMTPGRKFRKFLRTLQPELRTLRESRGGFGLSFEYEEWGDTELKTVYGTGMYRMSHRELASMLDSQKIYLSPQLPIKFYEGLKEWMKSLIAFPDENCCLAALACADLEMESFLERVGNQWEDYGFLSEGHYENLVGSSIAQIATMVVKTEDFRVLMGPDGKIFEREADKNDAFQLITASGCSGRVNGGQQLEIMTETFETILAAAEGGILVMTAIGYDAEGLKASDLKVYWNAFFEAVASSAADTLTHIFVNPFHKIVEGFGGAEFDELLAAFVDKWHPNFEKMKSLTVKNTDPIYLAYGLRQAFPHVKISLCMDVNCEESLGGVVDQTKICSMIGTHGLMDENVTHVLEESERIIEPGIFKDASGMKWHKEVKFVERKTK